MKRNAKTWALAAIALLLLPMFSLAQGGSADGKAQKVLEKLAKATGDWSKVKDAETARIQMTMEAQGMEIPITVQIHMKMGMAMEMSAMGQTMNVVTNEKYNWMAGPDGSIMSAERNEEGLSMMDENPSGMAMGVLSVLDYEENGTKVTYLEKKKLDDEPMLPGVKKVHVLRVVAKDGTAKTYWVDAKAYEVVMIGDSEGGKTYLLNYKGVQGARLPHKIVMGGSAGQGPMSGGTMRIQKMEFGVEIDPSIFEAPEGIEEKIGE